MQPAQTLILTLAATLGAHALGVNCKGNFECSSFFLDDDAYGNGAIIKRLIDATQAIDGGRQYSSEEYVACIPGYTIYGGLEGQKVEHGAMCAFLQKIGGTFSGNDVKAMLSNLQSHGCKACGSVPTDFDYPSKNDVSKGELTVNYVTYAIDGCNGLC